jgi:hypothetical protein
MRLHGNSKHLLAVGVAVLVGCTDITVQVADVETVALNPTTATVPVYGTINLQATPQARGRALIGRTIEWESADPAIATVSSGVVTGVSEGRVLIWANSQGQRSSAEIAVSPPPVARVTVEPAEHLLEVGATVQLVATPRDERDRPLSRPVVWSSDNHTAAVVDAASGLVTARAIGTATITASAEGKIEGARITVYTQPESVTGEATGITAHSATLNGSAQPGGLAAQSWFEWGTSAELGQATARQDLAAGGTAQVIVAPLGELAPRTTYHYRIVSSNQAGTRHGEVRSFTTLDVPPAAPSNLVATEQGTSAIHLSWQLNGANQSELRLERRTGVAGAWAQIHTLPAQATAYTDTGLNQHTTYLYRIRSCNAAGCSDFSNEAQATTAQVSPTAPSHLTATTMGTSIRLTWRDNSDNEAGFNVYRKYERDGYIDPNWTLQAHLRPAANDTAIVDPDKEVGATYHYRLTAYNLAGESAPSNETRATVHPAPQIAFSSDRTGNEELFAVNPDGTNVRQLTTSPSGTENRRPSWSPDRAKVVFQSNRSGNHDIWVVNTNGGGVPQNLTPGSNQGDGSPEWSPGGARIAFDSNREGTWQIYIMNADGTGVTRLTNGPAANFRPTWSPDGFKLAFVSTRDNDFEIYTINTDGSGLRRITTHAGEDNSPSWFPDGSMIAFERAREGTFDVWVVNVIGSDPPRLVTNGSHPRWSPDGTRLVFSRNVGGNVDIYTINPDGTGEQRVTTHPARDWTPAWHR